MKRIGILAVVILLLAGLWAVQAQQAQPPNPTEKTVTITESHLERLVEQRIAKRLLAEQKTLDQEVLDPKHWHTAIYEGVVYHVYTGPGDAMAVTWAQPPASDDATEAPPDNTSQTPPAGTSPTAPSGRSGTTPARSPAVPPTRRP